MDSERFQERKKSLESKLQQKIDGKYRLEIEYRTKMVNDTRWLKLDKLIEELKLQLKLLKQQYYDDNRVYRTGERQLATRIDGRGMRRDAALLLLLIK